MKPRATFAAAGLAVTAATAIQVVSPSWLQANMACDNAVGSAVLKLVSYVDRLKTTNPLGLTMGHGMLLKAIAEVLAQVIPQGVGASAWLDPLRVVRSTIASLLSSSLTFYYWTRLDFVRRLAAPGWLSGLVGRTLGTSLTKMVVTQAVYRPVNVFLFLGMQAFFRGDSMRQILNVLRTKFKGGLIGGIAFFAVSNMLMFSVPIPFLHPIIGAIAGLIFNVWLAMVAYKKVPETASAAASSTAVAARAPSAVDDGEYSSLSAFPTTVTALSAVALAEGAVAAGLYGFARSGVGVKGATQHMDISPTPTTSSVTSR